MQRLAFHNNEIVDLSSVKHLTSSAALYGKGVFTTVRISEGEPFLWEKHWRRLTHNAAAVGIDIKSYGSDDTLKSLCELVKANLIEDGRARITIFDLSPPQIWSSENKPGETAMWMVTGDLRSRPKPFRLKISPFLINSRSPLAGIKSCNYLEHLLAFEEAKGSGFHEAICLNEREELTSASMANLFWLRGDQLYTPSLRTGCIAGTTREFVMENVKCVEVERTRDSIYQADAIFLTSAGIGIAGVDELEGRKLKPVPIEIEQLIPQKNTSAGES